MFEQLTSGAGCNRSLPYYVFSKAAILGSVPSISSEVLELCYLSSGRLQSLSLMSFTHQKSDIWLAKKEETFASFRVQCRVVYMCSSLLQLAPGSLDVSQDEKKITVM